MGIPWVAIPLAHTGLLPVHGLDRVLGPGRGAVLRSARRVVALTESEVPLLRRLGVPEARLAVLPAALERADPPGYAASGSRRAGLTGRYVLQAGALGADKGTLTLLRAHALRAAAGRGDGLVLAGAADAAVAAALGSLSSESAGRTRLVPSPGDTPWHDLVAGAAVLAQPSRADAFGLVVLEAWRAGVPVVVADAGGLPRLVRHEVDGLVVPPDDPPALAAALDRLEDEPGLACRLGAAGRRRLREEMTWERVYPAWHRLLEQAMSGPAGEAAT
jgi:glycogen(starch) synthase